MLNEQEARQANLADDAHLREQEPYRDIGNMVDRCSHCRAWMFTAERVGFSCGESGEIISLDSE